MLDTLGFYEGPLRHNLNYMNTKKLSLAIVISVIVVVLGVVLGLYFVLRQGKMQNIPAQNLKLINDSNVYSVKSVLNLLNSNPNYFKGKEIQLKAAVVDAVEGMGCDDYFILMDKEDADTSHRLNNQYMDKNTSDTQRADIRQQIQQLPKILSGQTLALPQNVKINLNDYAIYRGHFNDVWESQNCSDGNKRFVIDGIVQKLSAVSSQPETKNTIIHGTGTCTLYGGKDIYTKGYAVTTDNTGKTIHITSDSCATKIKNTSSMESQSFIQGLSSCSGDNCYILKSFCREYQGTLIDGGEFIKCPRGCSNDACNHK